MSAKYILYTYVLLCLLPGIDASVYDPGGTGEILLSLGETSGLVYGCDIPGGELEYRRVTDAPGSWLEICWDGSDSAPETHDATGLGGIMLRRDCELRIDTRHLPLPVHVEVIIQDHRLKETAFTVTGAQVVLPGQSLQQSGVRVRSSECDLAAIGSVRVRIELVSTNMDLNALIRLAAGWFRTVHADSGGDRALIQADLLLQEGDTPTGAGSDPVSGLNTPFTDGNGVPGFTGTLQTATGSDGFVWYDDEIVWRNSDGAPLVLAGAEVTMGVGSSGEFIYSPSVDGQDAVWTDLGLLLQKGQEAPGYGSGTNISFCSRPNMLPAGHAAWISGFDDTGGTSTQGRVMYYSTDRNPANIMRLIKSDDMVAGYPIDRPSGVDFDYQISDLGTHLIAMLLLDTGSSADDGVVFVDGAVVARESLPAPANGNWDNFDRVTVNDSGNWAFSGDTDGSSDTDEFICYNGTFIFQEGGSCAGMALAAGSSVLVMSLNNLNQISHLWTVSGVDTLFFTCDPMAPATTSHKLLAEGDELDFDGDMSADCTVVSFNSTGSASPGSLLAEDGYLYLDLDVNFGAGDVEVMVRLALPDCGATPTPAPPTSTPTTGPSTPTSTPPTPPTPTPPHTFTPTPVPFTPTPPPTVTSTPVPFTPTSIPTPTIPPAGTPTPTPPDPTRTATATPPLPATSPPTMTATPDPCSQLGVDVEMPSDYFHAGDTCSCTVTACNPGTETYSDVPLFVILDVYGSYFFAPSFSEFDMYELDLTPGLHTVEVLPPFAWPADVGEASGLRWYAAMTDTGITTLFGDMDTFTFGWGA